MDPIVELEQQLDLLAAQPQQGAPTARLRDAQHAGQRIEAGAHVGDRRPVVHRQHVHPGELHAVGGRLREYGVPVERVVCADGSSYEADLLIAGIGAVPDQP